MHADLPPRFYKRTIPVCERVSSSSQGWPRSPIAKMGCGMSTEEKEGKQRNEEIENQLKRDKLSQRNEIKMLLLGMTAGAAQLTPLLIFC